MNITQVYLSSTILLIVLSGIIIGLLVAYAKLFGEFEKLSKKEIAEEKKLDDKTSKILEKAQSEYAQVIAEANKKAREILKSAVTVKKGSDKKLEKALEEFEKSQEEAITQAAKQVLNRYKIKMDEVSSKDINTIGNISKDIEKYTSAQVQDYKNIIEEETFASQKALGKKIDEEYKQTENELNDYKRNKLKAIDENIYRIVQETVKLTLEMSLTAKDGEDLVIEALEKAKQEGKLD